MTENQQMQPTQRHLTTMRKIAKMEAGDSLFINQADAEECENYGWVEAQPGGRYKLTDKGWRILAKADSN